MNSVVYFVKKLLKSQELEKVRSKHNKEIIVLDENGKIRLVVDGLTQSGKFVDQIWTKAISTLLKDKFLPNSCLILGLGGGTVAEIVKSTWPKTSLTGIEIDSRMIELGKKYLDLGKIDNLAVIIGDATLEINGLKKKFDLILVDMYKGGKIPKEVSSRKFISKLVSKLEKDGIIVFNLLFYNDKTKKEAEKFISLTKNQLEVTLLRELTNLLALGKRKSTLSQDFSSLNTFPGSKY